jgi:hypothetical protein
METLLDAVAALIAALGVMLVVYGAWLCLWPLQRGRSVDAPAPTSLRKRVRSISERLSASKR